MATRHIIMKRVNLLQKEILGRVRSLWKDLESENLNFKNDFVFYLFTAI